METVTVFRGDALLPSVILGLRLLTAFVLWIAALAVRRMQISYVAES